LNVGITNKKIKRATPQTTPVILVPADTWVSLTFSAHAVDVATVNMVTIAGFNNAFILFVLLLLKKHFNYRSQSRASSVNTCLLLVEMLYSKGLYRIVRCK
jgi:hypothetical protein